MCYITLSLTLRNFFPLIHRNKRFSQFSVAWSWLFIAYKIWFCFWRRTSKLIDSHFLTFGVSHITDLYEPFPLTDKVTNYSRSEKPFTAVYCVHHKVSSVLIPIPDHDFDTYTSVFSISEQILISTSDEGIALQCLIVFDVFLPLW